MGISAIIEDTNPIEDTMEVEPTFEGEMIFDRIIGSM